MRDPRNGAHWRRVRLIVLERAGYRCEFPGCLAPATTVDHIVPVAYGGTNDLANLRAACLPHNSAGGAKMTNDARTIGPRSRAW